MLRPQLKNSELCQSHTQQQSSLTHFNPPLVIYQALRNHLNKLMNECAEAVSLTPPEESPGFLVFEASASVLHSFLLKYRSSSVLHSTKSELLAVSHLLRFFLRIHVFVCIIPFAESFSDLLVFKSHPHFMSLAVTSYTYFRGLFPVKWM